MSWTALTTTVLPYAVEGVPFEASVAVNGATAAELTLSAGTTQTGKNALPSGLTYGTDGRLTGTPARGTAGAYALSTKVTDGTSTADNNALALNIFRSWEDVQRQAITDTPTAVLDHLLLA